MKLSFLKFTLIALSVLGLVMPSYAQTLKERDETAKAQYQSAKAQYQKEVNFYKNSRKNYIAARNKFNSAKNNENKQALEEAARDYLDTATNTLIVKLGLIKTWVSNRTAIDETEKQALIAELNADIAWLQERKDNIQSAAPAKIREEAQKVRGYWREHRAEVKNIVGRIKAARIEYILSTLQKFGDEVAKKIEELKAQGKDTTNLEAWYKDYEAKLAIAEQKYETAQARYKAIKGDPGPDFDKELREANRLFTEGNAFIKEANQYTIDAHKQLVKIVQEMKKPPVAEPPPTPAE